MHIKVNNREHYQNKIELSHQTYETYVKVAVQCYNNGLVLYVASNHVSKAVNSALDSSFKTNLFPHFDNAIA